MAAVLPLPYTLSSTFSVKWTATQEKSLSTDYPFADLATETPEDYVSRTYLQFLWLPESIMPLADLVPCLLRITSATSPRSSAGTTHPLHDFLRPLLLSPRAASQKYHTHIAQILADEGGAGDAEEHMMWFALKHDKSDGAQGQDAAPDDDASERWQRDFLDRMERREVQVQILLQLFLLSMPVPPHTPEPTDVLDRLPPHLSPRKHKRKRPVPPPSPPLPPAASEAVLEAFMDKLSMWQLMASLDDAAAHSTRTQSTDAHDWMQAFCTNVVEPLFMVALPGLCSLLREKVFPDARSSAGSSASSPRGSPQPQPKPKPKRASPGPTQRDRTRSLSLTLEAERARSASLGPSGLRKRALVREVSMSTAFKGKAAPKAKPAARAKATRVAPEPKHARAQSAQGVTLVAATPVKPKGKARAQAPSQAPFVAVEQESPTRMRRAAGHGRPARARLPPPTGIIEGDADDEEWTLQSSPDVLLLGSGSQDPAWGSDLEEDDLEQGGRVLAADTPTKARGGVR